VFIGVNNTAISVFGFSEPPEETFKCPTGKLSVMMFNLVQKRSLSLQWRIQK